MELTKEKFEQLQAENEKLKAENANKEKAFQEERNKRRELRDRIQALETASNEELETLRKEKAKREEQEAKKKGKYEELLAEKTTLLEELENKAKTLEEKAAKFDEYMNKQLETKLEAIPEDKREFVNKLLDGKDHSTKIELLEGFEKEFNLITKDFKNKPDGNAGGIDTDTTEYQKAKESGDLTSMIANAPVVE